MISFVMCNGIRRMPGNPFDGFQSHRPRREIFFALETGFRKSNLNNRVFFGSTSSSSAIDLVQTLTVPCRPLTLDSIRTPTRQTSGFKFFCYSFRVLQFCRCTHFLVLDVGHLNVHFFTVAIFSVLLFDTHGRVG